MQVVVMIKVRSMWWIFCSYTESDATIEDQQRLYEDLSHLDTEVTRELITRIAQKQCIFQHYKRLAIILAIPAFEHKIEETAEEGDEEICYQLLLAWKGQPNTDTTIKTLAKALVKIDPSLLVELHRAVFLWWVYVHVRRQSIQFYTDIMDTLLYMVTAYLVLLFCYVWANWLVS